MPTKKKEAKSEVKAKIRKGAAGTGRKETVWLSFTNSGKKE